MSVRTVNLASVVLLSLCCRSLPKGQHRLGTLQRLNLSLRRASDWRRQYVHLARDRPRTLLRWRWPGGSRDINSTNRSNELAVVTVAVL